jgi:hypothetical protein
MSKMQDMGNSPQFAALAIHGPDFDAADPDLGAFRLQLDLAEGVRLKTWTITMLLLFSEKGFFSFAAEKAEGRHDAGAAKLMKPCIELNTWSLCFCYTARALRPAAAVSDPAGLRSAAAPRRLAWSVTQTRNMGWRAFLRRSMIRSAASSK